MKIYQLDLVIRVTWYMYLFFITDRKAVVICNRLASARTSEQTARPYARAPQSISCDVLRAHTGPVLP
jgi:hypothetical protein